MAKLRLKAQMLLRFVLASQPKEHSVNSYQKENESNTFLPIMNDKPMGLRN